MPDLARAGTIFNGVQLPDASTLIVLGAGGGVVLVAVGVLAFAIRELRREAAERRRLYSRYRRIE
jgi:hypothetical protein